ncbi:MAG: exodeoxyribonuclease VII small subunit [Candidatus Hydrogenedentes bacterium]|nr:exodeoxyribonuclease VII small subunit [Candidatus Hydrogenedentota bacterium]
MARAKKENAAPEKEERNFEKDLEQLEQIVGALEEGGLSLDDALKRFEEGIRLARACEKTLSEAEKKIEILTKTAQGQLEAQPFEPEEGAGFAENSAISYDAPPDDLLEEEEEEDEKDLLF